ncbi:hypothetical protein RCL1_001810 [Eukaryota sp. TZLM3-RCL]
MNFSRESVKALIEEKDRIEERIGTIVSLLETEALGGSLTAPLVDIEGYPRSDIDIIQIRELRHELICLRNDLAEKEEQIWLGLHSVLPPESHVSEETETTTQPDVHPIFTISEVQPESPAYTAGLKPGHGVISFGSLSFDSLGVDDYVISAIDIVKQSINQPITVVVVNSENVVKELVLVPRKWNGPGMIGAKFQSL